MAPPLLPPLDFSRSDSSFATAATTPDTPTQKPCVNSAAPTLQLNPQATELDDGDSAYATTLTSSIHQPVQQRASSPADSLQQDIPLRFPSPEVIESETNVEIERPRQRPLSRLFSRRGTVNSQRSATTTASLRREPKKLVKRAAQRASTEYADVTKYEPVAQGEIGGEAERRLSVLTSAVAHPEKRWGSDGLGHVGGLKRTCSVFSRKEDRGEEWKSYRCDIHLSSNSTTFSKIMTHCRNLIISSGGKLLDDYTYPGGFLFQLPTQTALPLFEQARISSGTCITVTPWEPFPPALFNGLKLSPYGGAGELLVLPVPPHRSSSIMPRAGNERSRKREIEEANQKRVSSWLGSVASNYGKSMSHIAS